MTHRICTSLVTDADCWNNSDKEGSSADKRIHLERKQSAAQSKAFGFSLDVPLQELENAESENCETVQERKDIRGSKEFDRKCVPCYCVLLH